jgi:hypothetical protein
VCLPWAHSPLASTSMGRYGSPLRQLDSPQGICIQSVTELNRLGVYPARSFETYLMVS